MRTWTPGRGARRVAIALAGVLLTASCAAGQHAQTANIKPAIDGTQGKIGSINLEGVALLAPDGASYAKGSNAQMAITIVNSGTQSDTLVNVTSPSFAGWGVVPNADATSTSISGSPIPVDPNTAVRLGLAQTGASSTLSSKTLVVTVLEKQLFPGNAIDVTFTFERAGKAQLRVPVQLRASQGGATLPAEGDQSAA